MMGRLRRTVLAFFVFSLVFISLTSYAFAVEIIVDGNDADWTGISAIMTGDGEISSLSVLEEGDKLYLLVKGSNLNQTADFYIDTDNNSASGFWTSYWGNALGADYLFNNGDILRFTGEDNSTWAWLCTGSDTIVKTDTVVEASIDLSKIGMNAPGIIKVGYVRNAGEHLSVALYNPNSGGDSNQTNDADLGYISFNQGTLKPNFSSNKTEYSLHVASTTNSIEITPQLSDTNASIIVKREGNEVAGSSGTYTIELEQYVTNIKIEVTAEDNETKKTYEIVVVRTDREYSASASYATISASSCTTYYTNNLTFVLRGSDGSSLPNYADVFYFDIDIDGAGIQDGGYIWGGQFDGQVINDDVIIEKVLVTDENGRVKIPIDTPNEVEGENSIVIKIYNKHPLLCDDELLIAQQAFSVHEPPDNNVADLNNIIFNQGELKPDFSPDKTEYSLHVASTINIINITPQLSDANASFKVKREGNEITGTSGTYIIDLEQYITNIDIEVTAEDNETQKIYKVVVTRTDREYSASASYTILKNDNCANGTIDHILILRDKDGRAASNYADVYYYDIDVADNGIYDESYIWGGQFGGQEINEDVIIEKILVSDEDGRVGIPIDIPNEIDYGDGFTISVYNKHPSSEDELLIGRITYECKTFNTRLRKLNLIDFYDNDRLFGIFDSDDYEYDVDIFYSDNHLRLRAAAEDSNSTMKINGIERVNDEEVPLDLVVGENEIIIEVIAEDGVTKTVYTLNINRAVPSNNANMYGFSLRFGESQHDVLQLEPLFDENITEYNVNARYSINSVVIDRELRYPSTMTVTGVEVDPNIKNKVYLKEGINTVYITITAEDGLTQRTYTLTINRTKWDVADIENIVVNPGSLQPIFNKDVLEYNVNLSNEYKQLDVAATLADSMATLKINGVQCSNGRNLAVALNEGENKISLVVTSEDGLKTKEYVITVDCISLLPEEKILSNIIINNGEIDLGFSSDITSYTLADLSRIDYQLDIQPLLASETSSSAVYINDVEVNGSDHYTLDLNEGDNKIEILVLAKGNIVSNKYIINVTKASPEYSASASYITVDKALQEGVTSKLTIVIRDHTGHSIANHQDIFNFHMEVTDDDNTHNEQYVFDGEVVEESTIIRRVFTSDENGRIGINVTVPDWVDKGDGISIKLYNKMQGDDTLLVDSESYIQTHEYSHNANLSSLTVTEGTYEYEFDSVFHENTVSYSVYVPRTTEIIDITASLADTKGSMRINGQEQESGVAKAIALNIGSNIVEIETTAEDTHTQKTYGLNIIRAEQFSNNAEIKSLQIMAFDDIYTLDEPYIKNVDNSTNKVVVMVSAEHPKASVGIEKDCVNSRVVFLDVGQNIISIEITAEDGISAKEYYLVINRLEQQSTGGGPGGGGATGGGGGIVPPPVKVHIPSKPQILESAKTEADKEIDANLFYYEEAKLDLSEKEDKKRQVSVNTIKELAEKDKELTVEDSSYGIALKFNQQSLLSKETKGTKDEEATIEIGARNLTDTERQKILTDTKTGASTGVFAIGGKIFNLTAQVITSNEDGTENSTKIEKFTKPVAVTIKLADLDLTEEQIAQLSGVRLKKDNSGKLVPVKLGGTYDPETKTFTFYTDCFSYYTVMQFKYQFKLNMTIGNNKAQINDVEKTLDVPPMIINSRTMVPLRFIGEALGIEFAWDQKIKTVTYKLGPDQIKLTVGKTAPGLDTPLQIVNGRTLVPVRYISERFGADVYWNQKEQSVTIVK